MERCWSSQPPEWRLPHVMLVLIVIGLAVCIGLLAGGSLRPFERFRLHWWGVALAGLALQGLPISSVVSRPVGSVVLVGSYVLLGAFAWVNHRLPRCGW